MGTFHGRRNTRSRILKRSIIISGHKTSISLEDEFWDGLREIAAQQGVTMSTIVSTLDSDRQHLNLSSMIRLFVLDHYRAQANLRRSVEDPNKKGYPVRSRRP
jgi:predicted DNA-binding ribbon-helix-helix protein